MITFEEYDELTDMQVDNWHTAIMFCWQHNPHRLAQQESILTLSVIACTKYSDKNPGKHMMDVKEVASDRWPDIRREILRLKIHGGPEPWWYTMANSLT